MIPTTEALYRRVEEAAEGSRELDLELATALVPDVLVLRQRDDNSGADPYTHWHYTSKIDDALALVERMLPGWGCQVGRPIQTYTSGWYASVFRERLPGEHDMFAGSFSDFDGDRGGRPRDSYRLNGAIAIILALLRALSTIQSGGSDA